MLDNLTGLFFLVFLLSDKFKFPADFIVSSMVPGTALGVLIGDLAFVYFAFQLSKKTGRSDVTAMPLGLDTPSVFGMTMLILGPAFKTGVEDLGLSATDAAYRAWHIGIWCTVISGLIKLGLAPATGWIRRVVPRAGLLGSLAAIALVLIAFVPLGEIFASPLPGILALVIVLTTLIARIPLPGNIPGTLGALIVAGVAYYLMCAVGAPGYTTPHFEAIEWLPTQWLESWQFGWLNSLGDALPYLPIAIPFAIATVVGGIDCTESAAAAGDDYDTRTVIGVEAIATLIAGLSGGVIQTTPYIGHPAYKAMGGRAGYTLGTALLIGSAGLIGYFGFLEALIPKPVVMPILVFVGLEITAQSFIATPRRHFAAVALACLPALAYLISIKTGDALNEAGANVDNLPAYYQTGFQTNRMLSGGFILTGLFWAWALAAAIDRKLKVAAIVLGVCAGLTLFGIIHSPLDGNQMFLPIGPASWSDITLDAQYQAKVFEYAGGYAIAAIFLWAWALTTKVKPLREDATQEHE